jgi:hypothetical protein
MKKIICAFIFLGLIYCQNKENKMLINESQNFSFSNDTVGKIVEKFIDSIKQIENKNVVCGLYIYNSIDTMRIILYPIFYLSELIELKPITYFQINKDVVIIITGLEKIISKNPKFQERAFRYTKTLLKNNINNDNTFFYDKSYTFPCWEVIIIEDSIIVNKNARSPNSPSQFKEKIKFLPPAGEDILSGQHSAGSLARSVP